jgi:phosphatidate cytidylyltransferase
MAISAGLFFLGRETTHPFLLPALAVVLGTSLSFWIALEKLPEGFRYVLFAFSVVSVSDILAFVFGRFFSHRIPLQAPPFSLVSPRKTVVGYLGGALGALSAAYILWFVIPQFSFWQTAAAALILAASGAGGDLFASGVKRKYGTKDFSGLLGPIGGILDRLDSLLGAGWVFYLFLKALAIPI